MTGDACKDRSRKNRQKGGKSHVVGRQQKIENGRRHQDVGRREQQLPAEQAERGRAEPVAAQGDFGFPEGEGREETQREDQRDNSDPSQDLWADGGQRLKGIGVIGQRAEPDDGRPEPEGKGPEYGDRGDVVSGQSQGRIDAIAHGAAGDRTCPDGVAERVAQKPARHDDRERQLLAEISQGRPVISDQRGVACEHREQRQGDDVPGRAADLIHDVPEIHRFQQLVERKSPKRE